YFRDFAGGVAGSDMNAQAINWCRGNSGSRSSRRTALRRRSCSRTRASISCTRFSVFTHLTAKLQVAWRDELRRVLRPGGRLLMSTHGQSYVAQLDANERARFNAGELVVRWGEVVGSNLCGAYHPERYLRETFAQGFEFVEFEPQGALGNPTQDLV